MGVLTLGLFGVIYLLVASTLDFEIINEIFMSSLSVDVPHFKGTTLDFDVLCLFVCLFSVIYHIVSDLYIYIH